MFEVTPKYRVFAVKFEGNKEVKTSRLEKEIKTTPNTALDERQVKDDSEKLKEYYQKEGFNQVSVSYTSTATAPPAWGPSSSRSARARR